MDNVLDLVNQIEIYDDFFDLKIQNEIVEYLNRPKWSFGGGNGVSRFWHMDGLEKESYFSNYLFDIISEKIKRRYEILRIYANGQTACQSGTPHFDDGDFTFLYFPNKVWKSVMNGGLFFLNQLNNVSSGTVASSSKVEILKTVSYKSNRAVLFPAKIYHYADAPERHFTGLRVSLAYKLKSYT